MQYILALDQGTTSSRAILIDPSGANGIAIKGCAQKEFKQHFPHPGWVEHDPREIWSSQASVIMELLAHTGITAEDIATIGITNQRETTVVWDRKTSQPICPAIVWQDRRTTEYCEKLKQQQLEPLFQHKTGLRLDPYFSGTKLHWILKNIPTAREKAKRGELAFGTIDSWLIWKLTGGKRHLTDITNASRTLLYNIHKHKWDEELLEILEIPSSLLPQVCSSSELYGYTDKTLFSKEVPISGVAGDQQAALFGQGCINPGMAKTTYGTGCFMLMHTGEEPILSKHNLLTTIAYQIGSCIHYALEGSVFIAGAVVQWMRDNLSFIQHAADIEKLALSVESNGGVYFVPAFTGLGAPHWDPYARGTILGLTRGTTSAHIARAALEAIAFQATDVLSAMEADSSIPIKELRVDGGAVADNLLIQFQADLLKVPVLRPQITELTGLGAAYLAGLGIGLWKNKEELTSYWQLQGRFEPSMAPEEVSRLRNKWNQAIKCAQLWEER